MGLNTIHRPMTIQPSQPVSPQFDSQLTSQRRCVLGNGEQYLSPLRHFSRNIRHEGFVACRSAWSSLKDSRQHIHSGVQREAVYPETAQQDCVHGRGRCGVMDAVHLPFGCSVWPALWTRAFIFAPTPSFGEYADQQRVLIGLLVRIDFNGPWRTGLIHRRRNRYNGGHQRADYESDRSSMRTATRTSLHPTSSASFDPPPALPIA